MKKIRIGVLGAYCGTSMINYCKMAQNAELVAVCDKWEEGLNKQKEYNKGLDIAYYDNFVARKNTHLGRYVEIIPY